MTATAAPVRRGHDLHPADMDVRLAVIRDLANLRRSAGMSRAELGRRIGCTGEAVALAEKTAADPRVDRLQRTARGLNHRLTLTARFDPDLGANDPTVALFRRYAHHHPDPDTADEHHRSELLAHLTAQRRQLGLTARHVSRHIGRSESLISTLEQDAKPALLSSYQRYARGLGGHLAIDLQPLNPTHMTEGEQA